MSGLLEEITDLEAEIARLGHQAVDRAALENRVAALCQAATALPAVDAHALAPDLERLIAALDAASERLQSMPAPDDSPAPSHSAGAAAAAYGAALQNRRRRT